MLAGGRSSRFGSDKLATTYRGSPLLHHAVLGMARVVPEVVVVLAPGAPAPPMPAGATVRMARDPEEHGGPLVGLRAGLAAVRTDLAVVVGGDMPEFSTDVVDEMLRVAEDAGSGAVALQDGDGFRPLPCVVRVARADEAARRLLAAGERSLRALMQELQVTVIEEAAWHALDPSRGTLRDVDEPSDMEG